MTVDAIAQLAAANPVQEMPAVAPVERVRRLIEREAPAVHPRAPRHRSARVSTRAAAGILAVVAAVATCLALAGGSSAPGVNVLAAAYAATSSGSGAIRAVFVERLFSPVHSVSFRRREWLDASTHRRREQIAFHRSFSEVASSPGWVEFWNSGQPAPNPIRRYSSESTIVPLGAPAVAGLWPRSQGPVSPRTAEGIELYRQLYQEGALKLVGRERLHGRLLWKLEAIVAIGVPRAHAKPVPLQATIVLVDPSTYLPVVQRMVNLLRPGHPTMMESDLVSYRRLPADAVSEALFEVSAQHPGVRVLTRDPARTRASHALRAAGALQHR